MSFDLNTDERNIYKSIGRAFACHGTVNQSKDEWARGDVTTNTIESFFALFKRGMRGIYQHCGEQHLHRYLVEFDFRHNNRTALGVTDTERRDNAIRGATGKRLTYRRPHQAQVA